MTFCLISSSGLWEQSLQALRHHRHSQHHTGWTNGHHGRRTITRRFTPHPFHAISIRKGSHADKHQHWALHRHLDGQCHQAAEPGQPRPDSLLPHEDWRQRIRRCVQRRAPPRTLFATRAGPRKALTCAQDRIALSKRSTSRPMFTLAKKSSSAPLSSSRRMSRSSPIPSYRRTW